MINLIESGFNGILADEMGLGKTIQSIALLSYLKEFKKKSKFLVVAPKSVLSNWQKEFQIWAPDIKVVLLISVKGQRESILEKYVKTENFDVILTSYEGKLNKYNNLIIIQVSIYALKNSAQLISTQSLLMKVTS